MGWLKKDLSMILAGFQKTIRDLEELHDSHSEIIKVNDEVAANLNAESVALHAERKQALAIKEKIQGLISA